MLWLQSVGRVRVVLLLGHRQGTRESKGFGGMFSDGLLDVENPIHMFTLQYVYLRRINCALSEWMVSFNDHPVQTEHNWFTNQMWWDEMMNPCNPLAIDNLDDDPEDLTFYGEDPDGQPPLEDSDNNVEVFPAQLSRTRNPYVYHN